MANAKRASMREGPLAALFRKTEDQEAQPEGGSSAAAGSSPAAHPRESGLPHPALGAATLAPPPDEVRVPSPQERLRHAFSSEIPENVMEPAETLIERPSAGHAVMDDYAHGQTFSASPSANVGQPVIRVVGVGGAGVNAVNRMVEAEVEGIEFLAVNTDLQSLQQSTADITLHIGAELTRGLGSGSDANVGRQAAMEDYDRMKALLKGSDMIFITAGAGGGTGTGAAPVVARISREIGALTVAIVTKPFGFEGTRRSEQAERGVSALAEEVDTLIVVPNDRLLSVLDKQTAMVEAFRVADDVLRQGVQGISDLVTLPGLINLDFADVRTIMSEAGSALLGIGMGVGENRATEAALQAVSSPLLGNLDGRRALDPAVDHRRRQPVAVGGQRGRQVGLRGRAPRREHHLRRDGRREARRPGVGDGRGHRLRRRGQAQERQSLQRAGHRRGEGPARRPRAAEPGAIRGRQRRGGLSVDELEVPEFLPNF